MKEYHLIGIGSIGFTLAKLLIANRSGILVHLWDKDVVESHNIGFPKNSIGKLKTNVAAEILKDSVFVHNQFATNRVLDKYPNKFVIDCSDTKAKYNLNANVKVAFDGPLLVIADGRSRFSNTDIPFYYTQSKELIDKASRIILQNIKSSFSYTGIKKVYQLEKSPKNNTYLIHNTKRKCTKYKLQKDKNLFLPSSSILTKRITRLEKTTSNVSFKVDYFDNVSKNYKSVTFPVCNKNEFIKYLVNNVHLVPAEEYYMVLNNYYIDISTGIIDLTIYHQPTAC